jgi:RND family efflux transporter MFP subunit
MPRKLILFTGAIVLIGGLAAGAVVLQRSQPTSAQEPVAPPTVAVVKATRHTIDHMVEITAELHPFLQINVYAKIPGYLQTIGVDVGSRVKAGEVIARLDTPEQESDVARAETTFKEQKLEYDRVQAVIHQQPGLLAQEDVDKAQTAYDVAKANYEHAKVMEDYATITAPFDGVVTTRTADPGALIQAGTSPNAVPLVHIAEEDKLRLILPVPEDIVPDVRVGTPVTVTVSAIGKSFTAPVARISGQIDSATRTMETEVDLDNTAGLMTPGMYADAEIRIVQHKDALTVPVQALNGKDNPDVWLVGQDGKIVDRPVRLGISTPDRVEILNGLQEGDEVVFGARNAVSVGMRVTPQLVREGT